MNRVNNLSIPFSMYLKGCEMEIQVHFPFAYFHVINLLSSLVIGFCM